MLLAFFILIIVVGVLFPISIRVRLDINEDVFNILITAKYLYGLMKTKAKYRLELKCVLSLGAPMLFYIGRTGRVRKMELYFKRGKKAPNRILNIPRNAVRVDSISCVGKICSQDAFVCVLLCGIARIALLTGIEYIDNMVDNDRNGKKRKPVDAHIDIIPEFSRNGFRVNLEGILTVFPAKIILAAISGLAEKMRKACTPGGITFER